MQRKQGIAYFFIALLAGQEAARVYQNARASKKTADLDWPGCGKGTAGLTCNKPGCERKYLWLDTPRQSCRWTDVYKLEHDQLNFLKVELERLEEKTVKFSKTGCLYETGFSYDIYMWKCVRRTSQITRLSHFVTKAIEGARKVGESHPAYAYANSDEVSDALRRVGDNMAEGFDKYADKTGNSITIGEAFKKILAMPEEKAKAEKACGEQGCQTTEEQDRVSEDTYVSTAMVEMLGVKMTEEQRMTLEANIAGSEQESRNVDTDELIDQIDSDITSTNLGGLLSDEVGRLSAEQKEAFDSELDVKDLRGISSALVEVNESDAVTTKDGPLKWIFFHGAGWLLARIAWLFLFIIGMAIGIIRAGAVFPLLFVGCILSGTVKLLFHDLIYKAGWEGEGSAVVKGIKKMGKCPAWAWDFIGFDSTARGADLPAQVVVQPAVFASSATGVEHLWKGNTQLCEGISCGANAACRAGTCHCNGGFYPTGASDCGLTQSTNGCICLAVWSQRKFFGSNHYGCYSGSCKVDINHASYATCKPKLEAEQSGATKIWNGFTGGSPEFDTCINALHSQEVPAHA